ncbi:hypothetical protein [Natrialba sp. INN-245]|uniref:hypothetical protein n=1 Tax=Natrialba sp. INN-245 TaxID=2690967 RepID=UPI0013126B09|nr:hypothetical protein [Natrialba sp. INN-245]MWV41906.1 hypothetical protein [Natrialba sp. INN-245]
MVPDPPDSDEGLLICVDVLGAFGVTSAEIKRESGIDGPLEEILADALEDGRDRVAVLRRMIARSDRGVSCSARYSQESLESELAGVFEAVGWSFDCATAVSRDRLSASVVDHNGRRREATLEYPDSPLGTDNLPAILARIDETLLAGTGARFVLLSDGVDRWRAALVDGDEFEDLLERYGEQIEAVDRPLLPEHGLEAYVPSETRVSTPEGDGQDEPWPAWAGQRERDGVGVRTGDPKASTESSQATLEDVASFIEEAESDSRSGATDRSAAESEPETRGESTEQSRDEATPEPTWASADEGGTGETDGFELRGSPTVSRMSDEGDSRETDDDTGSPGATGGEPDEARGEGSPGSEEESTGFGTLSGTTKTARVSNDSFGSGVEWETEDDRYRALGMALGAGGAVSVEGVLEDDEFLPELPATEPDETRLEFDDEFDPTALPKAKATAEESGFVWMGSGSLETTRVSDG